MNQKYVYMYALYLCKGRRKDEKRDKYNPYDNENDNKNLHETVKENQ